MNDYVKLSLETHLFFARIMKEHSLFLMAGFPSKDSDYIKKADWYREKFEDLLRQVVQLSNGVVRENVLESGEITTEYTKEAERHTNCLTGIPIDTTITESERKLSPERSCQMAWQGQRNCRQVNQQNRQGQRNDRQRGQYNNRQNQQWEIRQQQMNQNVRAINEKALKLVTDLIDFKEKVLRDMTECCIYTTNYPLLIEHIIREAKLYRETIAELLDKGENCAENLRSSEQFWNQIMMEHALFIRGLLDPSEEELIQTANEFAQDYRKLLQEARNKDMRTMDERTRKTIQETLRFRDFKAAGTKGITDCQIESLILPLLADHVLREANHYLRILREGC